MIRKIKLCENWGVQIADCRYRPLDLDYDNYNSNLRHGQAIGSYYIHDKSGWTDKKVRDFRSIVRRHNIWIRYAKDNGRPYDRKMEKWSDIHSTFKFFKMGRPPQYEIIESSLKWKERIQIMNKVKRYFKINSVLSTFDFSGFSIKRIDEELKIILNDLNNNADHCKKNNGIIRVSALLF